MCKELLEEVAVEEAGSSVVDVAAAARVGRCPPSTHDKINHAVGFRGGRSTY